MEYMEGGLAVVSTAVGGIPDLITDRVTGRLVDRRDSVGLAAAIAELIDDPAQRREMGERGRARRRAEFGIDTTVRRVQELYELLYADATSRAGFG
jgi:starch synthase